LNGIREAFSGGMLMPPPVAQKVLRFLSNNQALRPNYNLSERERDVLEQMENGHTQREIAALLFISPSTVNGHIQKIYQKLHVHSSSAAVAKALRERLI
ncbi:MAG: response regulator transcription factor, partial [Rhodothermales bacterium]